MFDKNHLGHEFIKYDKYNLNDYICINCNTLINHIEGTYLDYAVIDLETNTILI